MQAIERGITAFLKACTEPSVQSILLVVRFGEGERGLTLGL